MALKFLNKKGWHTGSLRNIENVWKAEQKHEAEQKKLDELRKQIQEERERSEFRQLQEQAGLVPKQERLEFLYDSGLAVGKGSSSGGFKALESSSFQKTESETVVASSSTSSKQSSVPGALFEEKSHSANDTWRKLHSDPLLLIRQREQEALARVKNNPIQMAMIRKSVEATKSKGKKHDKDEDREPRSKHHHKKHQKSSSSKSHPNSEKAATSKGEERRKASRHQGSYGTSQNSDVESSDGDAKGKRSSSSKDCNYKKRRHADSPDPATEKDVGQWRKRESRDDFGREKHYSRHRESGPGYKDRDNGDGRNLQKSQYDSSSDMAAQGDGKPQNKRRNPSVKLSDEERAAKLREMQMDAECHEEQRWKRLKKAEENDAQEDVRSHLSGGRNFLDTVQKSVYGTEKGGSSTIEESVRRRTHYLQGRVESTDRNAFRR